MARTCARIAFLCHLLAILGYLVAAVIYLATPRFLPYHAEVLGRGWAELAAREQQLLLALLRGAGAAGLAASLALAGLLLVPFRRGERWAKVLLPAAGLTGALPVLLIAHQLHSATGADTPWLFAAAGVALFCGGALLSSVGRRPAESQRPART